MKVLISSFILIFTLNLNAQDMSFEYQAIGSFHSPLNPQTGAPRQGALEPGNSGMIELDPVYEKALKNLDKCNYIIVLYHMHLSKSWKNTVRPPGSAEEVGLFASRSPSRPNPIGFAVIRLDRIEGCKLYVSGIDAYDGTPVLDIKPWFPSVDCPIEDYKSDLEKNVGLPSSAH